MSQRSLRAGVLRHVGHSDGQAIVLREGTVKGVAICDPAHRPIGFEEQGILVWVGDRGHLVRGLLGHGGPQPVDVQDRIWRSRWPHGKRTWR